MSLWSELDSIILEKGSQPRGIIFQVLVMVGTALFWNHADASVLPSFFEQPAFSAALLLLIPFLSTISFIFDHLHCWLVAVAIFFFSSDRFLFVLGEVMNMSSLSFLSSTRQQQPKMSNRPSESQIIYVASGIVIMLIGSATSLFAVTHTSKRKLSCSLSIQIGAASIGFLGCLSYWNLARHLYLYSRLEALSIGFQVFYTLLVFLMGVHGSKTAQHMTVFLATCALQRLPNRIRESQDILRYAAALPCCVSLVSIIILISVYGGRIRVKESDDLVDVDRVPLAGSGRRQR